MHPIVGVALAAFDQAVGRERQRRFLARTMVVGASALVSATGVGFLVAGAYLALAERYGSPLAAAMVGAALCALAAALALTLRRRPGRLPARAVGGAGAGLVVAAPSRGDAQITVDELWRTLESAGALTTAFFLAGLSAGLAGRWLSRRRS
jgi:hypothetical protein